MTADGEQLSPAPKALVIEGRVESRTGVRRLAFGQSGRVARIDADVGEKVRRGQLLAQLDCSGVRAELTAAEAELDLQRLQVARRIRGPTAPEVEVAKERVELAQAELTAAEVDGERMGSMSRYKGGLVSRQELEIAARRTMAARLEVATARQTFERVQRPVLPEDTLEEAAREKIRLANVARVTYQLSLCKIVSPVDGIVAVIHLRSGEVANPADWVVSVVDDADRCVSVWIPQPAIGQVQAGRKLRIRIPALNEGAMDGVVTWVSPVMTTEYPATSGPCFFSCGARVWIDASAAIGTVPLYSTAYVHLRPH